MQVTETTSEGLKRAFKIVISASDIVEKIEYRLEELSSRINVPGFRPGKAPMTVLKQRFGGSVRDEVLEQAVKDASQQAIDERGLRPATTPNVEIVAQEEGKDLEYTIELEILPDIQPMDFSKIEVERLKVRVSDAEIAQALEQIASGRKQTQPLEKERMSGEDHHLELGSNAFVQGFEEQLVGADKGETKEIKVTFPEEYVNDRLAGREAVFTCTVKDILQAVVPAVDEAFATLVGEESLDALKNKIRTHIGQEYDRLARERMKRQMLDQLAEAHDFAVPETMVGAEFEAIWRQVQGDRERGVVDPEDEGKSEDDLQAEYRGIAERRVRLGLLLAEVGRLNELEVSQEEITGALYREASRFPGQEQQVVQFYQNNPQAMAQLRAPLFEEKVVDFISELSKVAEREVDAEDLKAEEEGGSGAAKKAKTSGAAKKPAKTKKPAAKASAKSGGAAKKAAPKGQAGTKGKAAKAADAG
jgi:trigger factor